MTGQQQRTRSRRRWIVAITLALTACGSSSVPSNSGGGGGELPPLRDETLDSELGSAVA